MKRKNHTHLGRLARGIFHLLRAILQLLREIRQLLREIKSAILQFAESSSREREKARATRGNEEMRRRTIRLSRQDKQEILAFMERPDFDTGRERNGHTCYAIRETARAWVLLKHPHHLPQSIDAFIRTYRSIKHRR